MKSAQSLYTLTIEIISGLLIILFLYTGLSKVLDFKGFKGEMYNQVFPHLTATFIIFTLPFVEILIAGALLFVKTRMGGFYASLILMLLFTIYTTSVLLHFFNRIPCSCGGVIKKLSWNQHLVLNLFFVTISIAGLILLKKNKSANNT